MWGVGVVKGRRIRCRECTNNVDIWIVCAVEDKRCIAMYIFVVVSGSGACWIEPGYIQRRDCISSVSRDVQQLRIHLMDTII